MKTAILLRKVDEMIPKILCSKIIEHCILFRISRQLKYYRKSNRTLLHWATIFFLSKMVWWIFKKMFLRFLRAHNHFTCIPQISKGPFLQFFLCKIYSLKYWTCRLWHATISPCNVRLSVRHSVSPSVRQQGGDLF